MLEVINIHDKNNENGILGLIEGDGAIHIPKNIKTASITRFSFHKDFILILQKALNIGNVYKIKMGKNAYSYTISDLKGLTCALRAPRFN